jgi:hypothetical protein
MGSRIGRRKKGSILTWVQQTVLNPPNKNFESVTPYGTKIAITFAQNELSLNKFRVVIGGVFNWQGQGDPRHAVKLKTEEWNHIVFVRQGREGTWYLNGEPDRKKKKGFYINLGSGNPVNGSIKNFRLGNSIWDEGRAYKGIVDEAFIFERALSQDTR